MLRDDEAIVRSSNECAQENRQVNERNVRVPAGARPADSYELMGAQSGAPAKIASTTTAGKAGARQLALDSGAPAPPPRAGCRPAPAAPSDYNNFGPVCASLFLLFSHTVPVTKAVFVSGLVRTRCPS